MTKAEKYIRNYTKNCSNELFGYDSNGNEINEFSPWLTPDHALAAVAIERKELLDKVCEWLKENATYIHPRKGKKTCIVNLNRLKEAFY